MIFLNNHVSGFRGLLPWKYRIRFYPPCHYNKENIASRVLRTFLVAITASEPVLLPRWACSPARFAARLFLVLATNNVLKMDIYRRWNETKSSGGWYYSERQ